MEDENSEQDGACAELASGEGSEAEAECRMLYAHHHCVQTWISLKAGADKGRCEVCKAAWTQNFDVPLDDAPTTEEVRRRLFAIVASAYLRQSFDIMRPADATVLERLAPLFEYNPGTHELTAWAKERIKKEKQLSFRFKKWYRDLKQKYSSSRS
ncbi:hypothetical protein CYMTET_22305 [Cymbomonas tetramitiformis]|uniref:RING-CH-type domain-containing protein n=1 Tax=Cymbomonas tetramitiformis TaxID=36881 RepID=A0AAE0G1K1_9CHLO|nr:hypothetical protein CYMTET_22305 [Cymbomonas tetramitiformis]